MEIKDRAPTTTAISKACGWARDFGDTIIFYDLRPPKRNTESGWLFEWAQISDQVMMQKHMWWCECPKCGYIGIQQYAELPCKCYPEASTVDLDHWDDIFGTHYSMDFTRTKKLFDAYKTARDYEF